MNVSYAIRSQTMSNPAKHVQTRIRPVYPVRWQWIICLRLDIWYCTFYGCNWDCFIIHLLFVFCMEISWNQRDPVEGNEIANCRWKVIPKSMLYHKGAMYSSKRSDQKGAMYSSIHCIILWSMDLAVIKVKFVQMISYLKIDNVCTQPEIATYDTIMYRIGRCVATSGCTYVIQFYNWLNSNYNWNIPKQLYFKSWWLFTDLNCKLFTVNPDHTWYNTDVHE